MTGTTGWTQRCVTATPPTGAVSAFVRAVAYAETDGAGKAWFDDVELRVT